MSGGHFDYNQYRIAYIADEIEQLVRNNDNERLDEWNQRIGRGYDHNTITEFKKAIRILRIAEAYAQRIDWLVSGDDGEDTFLERLREDLHKIEQQEKQDD